ncbi:DEAD/DEAH box helicase [Actinokineospora spheciospongiae]|uniref:DEAD/DEAH box helicase n=1 Tax=Actinokineospora spheciospongiae TaxID=909613 RepID=UPI000D713EB0|nr:DEAD/DEAH box helicase [Actinokineospora spheciospongiae]PWW58355.1 replicative superfamily II helicase [Actinokineospora spheciospongiae]
MSAEPGFGGLFIGVSQFASPEAQPVRYAKKDAIALHALFADTFGDGRAELLHDAAATRAAVTAGLRRLAATSTNNDVVVITYSGHGTPDHVLATHDTDPDNPTGTGLGLEELVRLLNAIPAGVLLVVLDCCFSGEPGDRVLHAPAPASRVDRVLAEVVGRGRVVLTASTAEQRAREDPVLRHGLLTHHLLAALCGAEEVVDGGRIDVLALINHVRRKVTGARSGGDARRQDPTFTGRLEGSTTLPILRPGPRYLAVRGAHEPGQVTARPSSLVRVGLSEPMARRWAEEIPHFNPLQLKAINTGGALAGFSVVVQAPPSGGKTAIGRLVADHAVSRGGRALILLPTRALVAELHDRLLRAHAGIATRVIRVTGEHTDQVGALLTATYDVGVLTYEMFLALLLRNPELLSQVRVLVVDEIHNLGNPSRGPALELTLMLVKLHHLDHQEPQIVGLSAATGSLGGLDTWLPASEVVSEDLPVPLVEGVLTPDGAFRHEVPGCQETTTTLFCPEPGVDLQVALVKSLLDEGEQVIVFRSTKHKAKSSAALLGDQLGLPGANTTLSAIPDDDLGAIGDRLRDCLHRGVAFHTSELSTVERTAVERGFRDRDIRVLVATTTLAQGVNLPVDTAVIGDLVHPDGTPYSHGEYRNMAGRAGRTGLSSRGRAIILARDAVDASAKWNRYPKGTGAPLRSAMRDGHIDAKRWVLHACAGRLASGTRPSGTDVAEFLKWSFASHQCRTSGEADPFPPDAVGPVLADLLERGLVRRVHTGYALTPLGEVAVTRSVRIESVVDVRAALAGIRPSEINRMTLIALAQTTAELDEVRFPAGSGDPRGEEAALIAAVVKQQIAPSLLRLLRSRTGWAARVRRAIACVLWMQGVPLRRIEAGLARHGEQAPPPVRQAATRTAEVVAAVVDIAHQLHPSLELEIMGTGLPAQLRLGVVTDLVPVAHRIGPGFRRGTFCALAGAGLRTPAAVLAAPPDLLLRCAGGDPHEADRVRAAADHVKASSDPVDFTALLDEPLN